MVSRESPTTRGSSLRRTYSPRATARPSFNAATIPPLLRVITLTRRIASSAATRAMMEAEPSVEPSSTTMSSKLLNEGSWRMLRSASSTYRTCVRVGDRENVCVCVCVCVCEGCVLSHCYLVSQSCMYPPIQLFTLKYPPPQNHSLTALYTGINTVTNGGDDGEWQHHDRSTLLPPLLPMMLPTTPWPSPAPAAADPPSSATATVAVAAAAAVEEAAVVVVVRQRSPI